MSAVNDQDVKYHVPLHTDANYTKITPKIFLDFLSYKRPNKGLMILFFDNGIWEYGIGLYGMSFQSHSLPGSILSTFYLCYQRKSLIRVLPLWTRNVWAKSSSGWWVISRGGWKFGSPPTMIPLKLLRFIPWKPLICGLHGNQTFDWKKWVCLMMVCISYSSISYMLPFHPTKKFNWIAFSNPSSCKPTRFEILPNPLDSFIIFKSHICT